MSRFFLSTLKPTPFSPNNKNMVENSTVTVHDKLTCEWASTAVKILISYFILTKIHELILLMTVQACRRCCHTRNWCYSVVMIVFVSHVSILVVSYCGRRNSIRLNWESSVQKIRLHGQNNST